MAALAPASPATVPAGRAAPAAIAARAMPAAPGGQSMEAMRAAARRFEAQALGALLQPIFADTGTGGRFGGGAAEAQWRPMLVDHYATAWSNRGGVGLADAVLGHMLRVQDNASETHRRG